MFKESMGNDLYNQFNVKPKNGWDITEGWKSLQNDTPICSYVKNITYRPFDNRYIFYQDELVWRTVHKVMDHMNELDNIALLTARSNKSGAATHFFVTDSMAEYKCGERTTNSIMFPLYIKGTEFTSNTVNYSRAEISKFEEFTSLKFNAQEENEGCDEFNEYDLFSYIYAYLYSNNFRKKYESFLCRDFPVVPYPNSKEMFWKLSELGCELINAHIFKTSFSENIEFIGNNTSIEKIEFVDDKVYINDTSYFSIVSSKEWSITIGGYNPCQRWLKERKGRKMTPDDVEWYKKMVGAIRKTNEVVELIDKIVLL